MTESEPAPSTLSGRTAWARNLETPLRQFLRTETGSAAILLAATIGALVWANVAAGSYESFWSTRLSVIIGSMGLSDTPARLGELRPDDVLLPGRRPGGAARVRHGRTARAETADAAAADRPGRNDRPDRASTWPPTRAAREPGAGARPCPPTPRSHSACWRWSVPGCPTGCAPTCSPSPSWMIWSDWPLSRSFTVRGCRCPRCWRGWASWSRWPASGPRACGSARSTSCSARPPGWRSSSPAWTRWWWGCSWACLPTRTLRPAATWSGPATCSGCSGSSPRPSWRARPVAASPWPSPPTNGSSSSTTRGRAISSCRCSPWPTPGW